MPISEEDKTEIQTLIGEALKTQVGPMMSAALKNEGKRMIAASVNEAVASTIKSTNWGEILGPALEPAIEKWVSENDENKPGGEGEKPGGQGNVDVESLPAFKGLKKQLDDAAKKIQAAEEREAAAKARQRDVTLRQQLSEALGKHGVDPKRMAHALSYLIDGTKSVRYSADDAEDIVFRDGEGADVDLATGLKSWAQTDDAKIYLPPRGASGSGDRPGGRVQTTTSGKLEPGSLGRMILGMTEGNGGGGQL